MTLQEKIESNSRKPMVELLKESAYLKFNDEEYGKAYCEGHCPYRYATYHWECPGGCKVWDEGMKEGQRIVYGADKLIGTVLHEGYQELGVSGINEPFKTENDRDYADMYWENSYGSDDGICAECECFGKSECPEDILSAKCPRSGEAWVVERITDAVNEVLKCNL